ncbi:MAG: hypothetical protein V1744_04750 [Candidatus Altiarchaeota archaeon]
MKGQMSFDFMVTLGVALVMFVLLLNAAFSQQEQAFDVMGASEARTILDDFAVRMNSVYLAGNNASRTHRLPGALKGGEYTLRVYPRSILLTYDVGQRRYYSTRTLAANISTDIADFSGKNIRIRNVGGTIQLENEE